MVSGFIKPLQLLSKLKQGQPDYKEGFKALFKAAKQREMKIALVTSSFLKDVKHHFEGSVFFEQFDAVVTAEKVSNGKPAPDCYLMACGELNVAPKDCLVLEDSNNGMLSGLDAGCKAAMIPDLLPPNHEINKRATYILDSLDKVVPLLDS